ncbi:MAG: hypothetical protein GW946_01530 [Candidatus Pacebacteria bacterium]|nr:hypothetical protein [Candidatus Paceibacterota bacterium]PIR60605.1 MAG: hypothetical protein COU67_01475 [Candidatus Pacebacteria bacterium CG10_big_fil_rev_8_21_14_0_10_44_54]
MLKSRVLTILLLLCWLFCGIVATLAGFSSFFYSWLWMVLLFPSGLFLLVAWRVLRQFFKLPRLEKLLFALVFFILLLHFLQVFVPETGFDALWYHLPLAQLLSENHQFIYSPELYQSANPQFADSIFALGFVAAGGLGTKLVAFSFATTLLLVLYQVAQIFLGRTWSLFAVLAVSLFQVVSWQAGSFYIDIAKAVFDLSAVWLVLESFFVSEQKNKQRYLLAAALVFSASAASKAFSILLLPSIMFSLVLAVPKLRASMLVIPILALVLLALPFYLFSFQNTGSLFFSTIVQADQLSVFEYVVRQVLRFPFFFINLFFTRDYTSPLLGLLPLAMYFLRKQIWQNKQLQILLFVTVNQLAIWWLVPPLSTRYGLAGFITGLILVLVWLSQQKQNRLLPLLVLVTLIFLLPRLVVAKRSLAYLLGGQTEFEYVKQFTDDNNAWLLDAWYHE